MDFTKFLNPKLVLFAFVCCATIFPNAVNAQCIQSDMSIQANLSGSKQPANRETKRKMTSHPRCTGNVQSTTGVQLNTGGRGTPTQNREVNQTIKESEGNETGIDSQTIQFKNGVIVDIINPADRFEY